MDELRSLWRYYQAVFRRVWPECVHSWKREVQGNVVVSLITYAITLHEKGAWMATKVAVLANFIWLGTFIAWHLIRTPWLLQGEGIPEELIRRSANLGKLPLYLHDLEVALLSCTDGITLDFDRRTIFLHLAVFSHVEKHVHKIKTEITIGGMKYEADPLDDLSGWELVTPSTDSKYPYRSRTVTNMNDMSLWRDIRQHGIAMGLHRQGWIAARINKIMSDTDKMERVKLVITTVEQSNPYSFVFPNLKKSDSQIRDVAFK